MDYKSVFTNLCLELQQNRSWIKGLGKNPFTHSIPFTHSLTAVPFVRGHRSVFPRTPRNTGVYTRHPTFVTATSGVLTRLLAKLSKNGMRVYTLSDRRLKKKLRVYTASEAKGLTAILIHYSKKLKQHFDIMIFIERYPLKRCQGCVKLIASKVNCFLNINDLSEVQLCMSSNSWTWECPHTKDGADHVPLIFLSSVYMYII